MTTEVEAVYRNGVFEPKEPVALPNEQSVSLLVRSHTADDMREWLAKVREFQKRVVARRGCLPDSTVDIAEDRRR